MFTVFFVCLIVFLLDCFTSCSVEKKEETYLMHQHAFVKENPNPESIFLFICMTFSFLGHLNSEHCNASQKHFLFPPSLPSLCALYECMTCMCLKLPFTNHMHPERVQANKGSSLYVCHGGHSCI